MAIFQKSMSVHVSTTFLTTTHFLLPPKWFRLAIAKIWAPILNGSLQRHEQKQEKDDDVDDNREEEANNHHTV